VDCRRQAIQFGNFTNFVTFAAPCGNCGDFQAGYLVFKCQNQVNGADVTGFPKPARWKRFVISCFNDSGPAKSNRIVLSVRAFVWSRLALCPMPGEERISGQSPKYPISLRKARLANETPRRKQRGIITDLLFYSSSQATGNSTPRD
jgi:hypothetical protein